MNDTLHLVKLLLNSIFYNKYYNYIDKVIEDNKEIKTLIKYIEILHTKYNKDISLEELSLFVLTNCVDKDKETYALLLQRLAQTDETSLVFEDVITGLLQRHKAYELALAALEVSEGRKDFTDLQVLANELNAVQSDCASPEAIFVTNDLRELHNEQVTTTGLRWRLSTLNRMLGSLRKGDFGFIFARPESFSRDTEVLTPNGWVPVDQVTKETYISQVNSDLTTTFVKPEAIHPHEQTHCYHIHDKLGRVDLIVTEGHGMIYEENGKLWKERADTIKYYQGRKHHVSAATSLVDYVDFLPEHRLAIAYQADGHTRNYKEYGYTFSFKKERKQQRLKEILSNCGYEYSEYKDGNRGHKGYYVKSKIKLYKDFDWINLSLVSKDWCQQFIEELSYWDATRRTETRFKFDTTNKSVADKVQAIAILAGYNCLLSVHIDDRSPNYKDIYSLMIRTNYKPVDGQCIVKERIPFTDTTYCFEVPSGMLLVRRNGAVAVSGNTGKTTFLASEVSNFATQVNKPILWLNNEEQGGKVQLRLYQAMLGCTLTELFSDIDGNQKRYMELGGSNIKIYDSASIHRKQVEQIVRELEPSLIIFDQIDKIKGFADDREDLRLGSIYIWARELAKQYCPVIGVSQADASGEGKKWLTMENVANAKTAKQAEADWILGIGKSHADNDQENRYLHLSKNKLAGDEDTDPDLRHGKAVVLIDAHIARYKDL